MEIVNGVDCAVVLRVELMISVGVLGVLGSYLSAL